MHRAFECNKISEETFLKWNKGYEKDSPLFVEGVWDGVGDYSSAIEYRKMFIDQPNRVNVELHLVSEDKSISTKNFVNLFSSIACHFDCSYINAENKGYGFYDRNVFSDRVYVGWVLYLPHIVLPELISEAARTVPVFDGENQKGTIIVSTEEIFYGCNKYHIGKANDIEIRLLDLGLLPLITEL